MGEERRPPQGGTTRTGILESLRQPPCTEYDAQNNHQPVTRLGRIACRHVCRLDVALLHDENVMER